MSLGEMWFSAESEPEVFYGIIEAVFCEQCVCEVVVYVRALWF